MAADRMRDVGAMVIAQSSAKAKTLKEKTPVRCAKRAQAVRTVFFFSGVHRASTRGIMLSESHWSQHCMREPPVESMRDEARGNGMSWRGLVCCQ